MATYTRHLTGDHTYALAMARSRDLMKHGGIVGAGGDDVRGDIIAGALHAAALCDGVSPPCRLATQQ
jgi:hypothetical protein